MKPIYYRVVFIAAVSLFACKADQIPTIHIEKESPIICDLKESCRIIYHDKEISTTAEAKIKCRGGMSIRYAKRSYSLELDTKFALGNLPADDDWIINANYIDKTFMRHKISYDLFREMNPDKNLAAQSAYLNLIINDNYKGLYVLMEEVNGSFLGLKKKDTLAMVFKDPPIFYEEKISLIQDSLNYYQQKFPKIWKSDKTTYLEAFKNFLFNSSDKEFISHIQDWVDLDNVIDWHLILLFSNNGDGIMKNFYLYKVDALTPFRFAIWDYDHSFGRDGDNELNMAKKPLKWERSIMLKRLVELTETRYTSKIKQRWKELRKSNILSVENFENHVYQNHQIIESELKKNFSIWPCSSKWYFDNNGYQQEIDLMINFVKFRIAELDEYIEKL